MSNLLGSIGGREVDTDPPPTMGAHAIEPEAVDGLGVMTIETPSREQRERAEAERHRAIASADRQRILERLAFVKGQPLQPVALADVMNTKLNPFMTLADARAVIEDCGGSIRVGNHDGTIRIELPELLDADPLANEAARRTALEAAVTLDAARAVVCHCLTKRKPLPALRPAAGGGVA